MNTIRMISKSVLLSAVLAAIACLTGTSSARAQSPRPSRLPVRPAPGEFPPADFSPRPAPAPLPVPLPAPAPDYGNPTIGSRPTRDIWDANKSADYLRMVGQGQTEIIDITGRDPKGGYVWYRRVLGTAVTGTGPDGRTVLIVDLDTEYMKYVGPWDPAGNPPHPYAKP